MSKESNFHLICFSNDPSEALTDDLISEDFDDDQFLTPTNEEKDFMAQRSVRADVIPLVNLKAIYFINSGLQQGSA